MSGNGSYFWTWAVRSYLERLVAGEFRSPEVQLFFEEFGTRIFFFPDGVIRILNFKWFECRLFALGDGVVNFAEIVGQDAYREPVANSMMCGAEQDVNIFLDTHQAEAN